MTRPKPIEPEPDREPALSEEKAAGARFGLRAFGLIVIGAVAGLTAMYALRPDTEPLEEAGPIAAATVVQGPATTADADEGHDPAPALLILTEHLFPSTDAVKYAGRQTRLDGMVVTETVGERFVYVRPATMPNELPLLVDVADARDLELAPSQVVTVGGTIRLADEAIKTVLSERQGERLDEARIYLDAETIVAPPES